MFFDKYQSKKDGVIRGYDIRSGKVKVLAGVIMIICMIMVVICLFPRNTPTKSASGCRRLLATPTMK